MSYSPHGPPSSQPDYYTPPAHQNPPSSQADFYSASYEDRDSSFSIPRKPVGTPPRTPTRSRLWSESEWSNFEKQSDDSRAPFAAAAARMHQDSPEAVEERESGDYQYADITRPRDSPNAERRPFQKSALARAASRQSTATTMSGLSEKSDEQNLVREDHKWYHWLRFKKKNIPPVPKQRGVCPEYYANVLSRATWQWVAPLLAVGYQRPLELNDLWTVNPKRSTDVMTTKLNESFNRRLRGGGKRPLLGALYETFKFEFILGGLCQLTAAIIQVINPFILRYLIRFAGEAYAAQLAGTDGPNVAEGIGLVLGVSFLQLIQSVCTDQFLYRGMMNGGQARAVLITVIFDKAMRLSGRAKAGTADPPPGIKPGSKEERNWFKKMFAGKKGKPGAADGAGWTNGRIINLMSVDTYRVDQASGMFHMIWTAPIQIAITLVLLLVNITYSALSGFALLIISTPILARAIRSLLQRRRAINKITDQRVSLTQEILSSVRFVKYFGWEESFMERIRQLRSQEILSIQFLLSIRNGINAVSMSMPIFASMLSFITYALSDHGLKPSLIFSSLALFNSLRLPLNLLPMVLGQVIDATSSIQRIQEFLMAEEAKDESIMDYSSKNAINVQQGTFTWEQTQDKGDGAGGRPGTATTRPNTATSAGRPGTSGTVNTANTARSSRLSRFGMFPWEKFGHSKPPASMGGPQSEKDTGSVKGDDELLDSGTTLAEIMEELRRPFQIKDLTFNVGRGELVAVIGGVGSGKSSLLAALAGDMRKTAGNVTLGTNRAFCPQYAWIQNATVRENIVFGREYDEDWYNRVLEACALKQDMKILPNGDGTEIGERGITLSGGQKQRLNIARAIYFDAEIVLMDDPLSAVDAHVGRHIMDNAICGLLGDKCRILATHQLWVLNRCDRILWLEDGRIKAHDTFDNLMESSPEFAKLVANNAQEEKKQDQGSGDKEEEGKAKKGKKGKGKKGALMQIEERAINSVSWSVYGAYFKAAGGLWVVPLVAFLLIVSQGANICTSLWLSWWTSDRFGLTTGAYIGIYAGLGGAQALLLFIYAVSISVFGTQASKVMLHRALTRVLRAPMSFFDTTPLGRITNRFSKDIDTMDNVLGDSIRMFTLTMGMIVSVFILIIAYYYYFAVALVPLAILFVTSAGFYRASAREIKRHESVLRSHVFSRFSEAVSGISTIRAYGLQKQFSRTIREAVDNMDSAYFLTFANQRWLSIRLGMIGNLLVLVVGILVVTSRVSVNPSAGGLVLSYILSIVQMIMFTVRQLAEVENNMNAVERIHHYGSNLEEEAPPHAAIVPEDWPEGGEIVFDDVEMRYRQGLPLVLKGFNMHVKAGERIGVVGRTGAGKSSIMAALFRLVELSNGFISIDGIDISTVGLADLRSRLAIIPQDPTLFYGTIRSNLDPFNVYSDLELWSALRQADLVGQSADMNDRTQRIHLESPVEEEGTNFSLGQRQLMAMARALVRGSQIIVCDEATSSVDMETDQKIQRTMAEGFRGKTLLCIAHRLKTIIGYDRICVMDDGVIAEMDEPLRLWENEEGIFRSMCDQSSIKREDFYEARNPLPLQ